MENYKLDKLRNLPTKGVAGRLGLIVSKHKCHHHAKHHAHPSGLVPSMVQTNDSRNRAHSAFRPDSANFGRHFFASKKQKQDRVHHPI